MNEDQSKGSTAPHVTPDDIKSAIFREFYFTARDGIYKRLNFINEDYNIVGSLDRLTFCVLVLKNGFTVTGESACVSPENFDVELGRKIARQDAINKLWLLMGFAKADRLHCGD